MRCVYLRWYAWALLLLASPAWAIEATREVPNDTSDFSWRVYQSLGKSMDGNVLIAPQCLYSALSAVQAGAANQTVDELNQLLGPWREGTRPMITIPAKEAGQLVTSNLLWLQDGYSLSNQYTRRVQSQLDFAVERVDFREAQEQSVDHINKYISQVTRNLIGELLTVKDVPPRTRLLITSSFYFQVGWEYPFDPEKNLTGEPFWLTPQQSAPVTLMRSLREYELADFDQYQVLALPYRAKNLVMLLVVPRQRDGLKLVERQWSTLPTRSWIDHLEKQQLLVEIPRFSITNRLQLNDTLRQLGVRSAFDPDRADLSGITSEEQLCLANVIQQAKIEVDEVGTTAAASTAISVVPRSAVEYKQLRVDRPFLFCVADRATGTTLLLGRFVQP